MTPVQVAYIVGSGHSGSTLLNLMLNAHSEMLGLSECDVIGRYIPGRDATRDSSLLDDPFWLAVRGRYEALAQQPFDAINLECRGYRQWRDAQRSSWREMNRAFLTAVAEVSGRHILVDASKRPERLRLLRPTDGLSFRVIHLIRDGRGVVNSVLRKYGKFGKALRSWALPNLHALELRRHFDPGHWLQVRYETLASEPAVTLGRICDFLGVAYEPAMLDFQNAYYVGIEGNHRVVTQPDSRVALDERWRREFPLQHRALFALLGGWLNVIYGYPP